MTEERIGMAVEGFGPEEPRWRLVQFLTLHQRLDEAAVVQAGVPLKISSRKQIVPLANQVLAQQAGTDAYPALQVEMGWMPIHPNTREPRRRPTWEEYPGKQQPVVLQKLLINTQQIEVTRGDYNSIRDWEQFPSGPGTYGKFILIWVYPTPECQEEIQEVEKDEQRWKEIRSQERQELLQSRSVIREFLNGSKVPEPLDYDFKKMLFRSTEFDISVSLLQMRDIQVLSFSSSCGPKSERLTFLVRAEDRERYLQAQQEIQQEEKEEAEKEHWIRWVIAKMPLKKPDHPQFSIRLPGGSVRVGQVFENWLRSEFPKHPLGVGNAELWKTKKAEVRQQWQEILSQLRTTLEELQPYYRDLDALLQQKLVNSLNDSLHMAVDGGFNIDVLRRRIIARVFQIHQDHQSQLLLEKQKQQHELEVRRHLQQDYLRVQGDVSKHLLELCCIPSFCFMRVGKEAIPAVLKEEADLLQTEGLTLVPFE